MFCVVSQCSHTWWTSGKPRESWSVSRESWMFLGEHVLHVVHVVLFCDECRQNANFKHIFFTGPNERPRKDVYGKLAS